MRRESRRVLSRIFPAQYARTVSLSTSERQSIEVGLRSLRDPFLRELQEIADAGYGMSVFVLALPIIETIGHAHSGEVGHEKAWKIAVSEYLAPINDVYRRVIGLYSEYRCDVVHYLSARNVGFVSGDDNAAHLTLVDGTLRLHARTFAKDVEAAVDSFERRALDDEAVGRSAAAFFAVRGPIGAATYELRSRHMAHSLSVPTGSQNLTIESSPPGE
jgi:hypothetical protein